MLSAWKVIETETRFQIFLIQNGMGIFTKEDTSHGQTGVDNTLLYTTVANNLGELQKYIFS